MARSTPRPLGEIQHGLLEILVPGDHDPLGAVFQRPFLLARRTDGADDARAGFDCQLRGEQPDTAADGVDQNRFSRRDAVNRMQHVIAGQRLHRERSPDVERDRVRQRHQHIGGHDRLLRIGAALLQERRDAVADFHAA